MFKQKGRPDLKRKDLSGVQRYIKTKHRSLEGMSGIAPSGEAGISFINRERFLFP